MVTKVFVAKVNRIVNDKKNNYYIHRINIPSEVVDELGLGKEDYLLFKAKKAEWFDMLDWSTMKETWDKLPEEIKKKIQEDGIIDETENFANNRKYGQSQITAGGILTETKSKTGTRIPVVTSG